MMAPRMSSGFAGIVAAAIVMTGCGHLQVKVDVLNPRVIESEIDRAYLRDALPVVLAQTDQDVQTGFNQWKDQHRKFYRELADSYLQSAAALAPSTPEKELKPLRDAALFLVPDFEMASAPRYAKGVEDVVAVNTQVKALDARVARGDAGPAAKDALVAALRQRGALIRNFERYVGRDTNDKIQRAPIQFGISIPQRVKTAAIAASTPAPSLTQGGDLIDSPYAFAVAGADEQDWSRYYNQTIGSGQFGNFDVAIRMVSLGDFTIKGVMFDPSDVARAVSRVAVQSLATAASAYGVPVRLPTSSGATTTTPPPDGTALAQASTQLSQAQEAAARTEAKLQNYRDALVSIGQAILQERSKIRGTKDERSAAKAAIKATFDAQKPRLQLQAQAP